MSFSSGYYPDKLKIVEVIPIHKGALYKILTIFVLYRYCLFLIIIINLFSLRHKLHAHMINTIYISSKHYNNE